MKVTVDDVNQFISEQIDPYLQTDLISAGCIKSVTVDEKEKPTVNIAIEIGFYAQEHTKAMVHEYEAALREKFQCAVKVSCRSNVIAHKVQGTLKPLPNVKNIIAIASGKGGVGKSTTSVNLAFSLAKEGARVGILDADIYGPSLPTMLGVHETPKSLDGKSMEPVMAQGLQTNSIGYLIAERDAAIWRAPMAVSALAQMLKETNWDNLDYLIVDMPPGTGDIQLTLAQQIPVAGSVIVTTPQDIALLDARKGIGMFNKVNIPILGIIENMSYHICSNCGYEEAIFGEGGGEQVSDDYGINLLGKMPLDLRIREEADQGHPSASSDHELAMLYQELAIKMAAQLSLRERDFAGRFPKIVVENN